jgi:dTDP-4-amino-4,6-dideoxygalactose transaminase
MISFNPWPRDYMYNKKWYDDIFQSTMCYTNESVVHFEEDIAYAVGRKHAIAVGSATDALHFSLKAYDIGPGDEVLVSNFSWISSASCVQMVGADPVFCDIDLDTYCVSLDSLKRMKSNKTKAVIYTPLFGITTDTTELEEWCKSENLILVEDAAQAWGAKYGDKRAGSIGQISSFSFNTNKVVASPTGGGVILTDDDQVASYCRKLMRHGNVGEFLGYNSRMYPLSTEILKFRIRQEEELVLIRQKMAEFYNAQLEDLNPVMTNNLVFHNYHKYTLRLDDSEHREFVMQMLRKASIESDIKYSKPLNQNEMFLGFKSDKTPNTEEVCNTIMTIPNHAWLTQEETQKIVDVILASA